MIVKSLLIMGIELLVIVGIAAYAFLKGKISLPTGIGSLGAPVVSTTSLHGDPPQLTPQEIQARNDAIITDTRLEGGFSKTGSNISSDGFVLGLPS